jgi:RNA 3'-terminal phosphate cyclase-like protein
LKDIVDKARNIFNNYLPDVWIATDFFKGKQASLSSGYSLTLKAETTTGTILTFDASHEG